MPSRVCNVTRCLWRVAGRFRSSGGFTLAELIIVIVMAALLSAVVGMKSGWLTSGYNLRMALDQVAGDLRFLQCRTMATMSSTGATYTNTVSFPTGASAYNLGGQVKSLPSGVTISSGLTVTFNSLGEYPGPDATFTLNSKGSTGAIKIYHLSGDVEAY